MHTPVLRFRFLIAQVTGDVDNSWRSVWSKHDSYRLPRKCPVSGAAIRPQLQVCAERAQPGCRWDRSRFTLKPNDHYWCWPCVFTLWPHLRSIADSILYVCCCCCCCCLTEVDFWLHLALFDLTVNRGEAVWGWLRLISGLFCNQTPCLYIWGRSQAERSAP